MPVPRGVQVVPALEVTSTVPSLPVAEQALAEAQLTARRSAPLAGVCWAVQVCPPSPLVCAVPFEPTAKQRCVVGQLAPKRGFVVGEPALDHEPPPSMLSRIVPELPTATHALADAQLTAFRDSCVPEATLDHVEPPSSLLKALPWSPTATQMFVPGGQLTPSSVAAPRVPDVSAIARQVEPSCVRTTVPRSPTATHALALAQLTAFRRSRVPGSC